MTPAARVQAAIEILDLVIAAARSNGAPADRILGEWFRTRRFAGSKDRRAVRDLVYRAIRACGDIPVSGRAAMLRLAEDDSALVPLFDGSVHGPAPIRDGEAVAAGGVAPGWLENRLAASGIADEVARALLERAPLDIRVNALKTGRVDLPEGGEPITIVDGYRYPHGTRIEDSPAYLDGAIEVQDAGSQLACNAVAVPKGGVAIDLCAGAGGKSLALAAQAGPMGKVIASDTDRSRLSRLAPRAARAGADSIIETRLLNPGQELAALGDLEGKADTVLVDAPCSGTGTWRRNPEARWRLSPDWLAGVTALQARLLDIAATLVKPGGALVYVTCSLLDEEGRDQIDAFLSRNSGWDTQVLALGAGEPRGQGLRLSPCRDGTDGFFIARLSRLC